MVCIRSCLNDFKINGNLASKYLEICYVIEESYRKFWEFLDLRWKMYLLHIVVGKSWPTNLQCTSLSYWGHSLCTYWTWAQNPLSSIPLLADKTLRYRTAKEHSKIHWWLMFYLRKRHIYIKEYFGILNFIYFGLWEKFLKWINISIFIKERLLMVFDWVSKAFVIYIISGCTPFYG